MKKIIAAALAAVMAASCLAGCGSSDNSTTGTNSNVKLGDTGGLELPLDTKNTELRFLVCSSKENMNDSYVLQKLREVTGINVQLMVFPSSTIAEKRKVMVASKDIPDIMGSSFATMDEINDLGVQGAFAPVNDYIDVMPNFKKIFVDDPENNWIFKSYQASDGKLYGLPWYEVQRDVNHGILYRKDVFDKLNIPMWNSPEEFYQALKTLKSAYPGVAPFTSKNKDNLFNQLSISWGLIAYKPYYDEAAKEWKYSDTDPQMKNMLDYMAKLYKEGLLDPEFLTLTEAAWTSKMTQPDKAFVTFDWIGRLDTFKEQTKGTYPEYDLRYGNPIGPKQTIKKLSKVFASSTIANNKNTELSMKLNDFLLSPAGAELITMGVEGETYTLDEKGMAVYTAFDAGKKVEIGELEEKYGMFLEGMYRRFDKRSTYFNFSEKEQEAQDKVLKENMSEPEDPILAFTTEEKDALSGKEVKLKTAAQEFFAKYVLGQESGDAAWNAWVEKANNLGAQDIVKIYNDAQKRYDSAR